MATPVRETRPLFRVEYDKLIALGAFADEKIELLDGALVPMSPIGAPHASVVDRLTVMLIRALGDRARVRIQNPFAAGDLSEPEPDVTIVPFKDYDDDHPDVAFLIIEVAESSLGKDQKLKARIYAERNVPEYWIVNLVDRRIEVSREPLHGSYQQQGNYGQADVIALLAFPDVMIRVDDVIRFAR